MTQLIALHVWAHLKSSIAERQQAQREAHARLYSACATMSCLCVYHMVLEKRAFCVRGYAKTAVKMLPNA